MQRRGVALVLVLVAAMVAVTLSYTYIAAQSTTVSISRNIESYSHTRQVTETGLRLTLAYIQRTESWRTDQPSGTWVTDEPIDTGTFTVVAEDGQDTNGDGVIAVPAEGDGDVSDNSGDVFTLTVTGKVNDTTHVIRAVVTPTAMANKKLLFVVPNPSSLSTQDEERKTLFESWDYDVTPIDDGASSSTFDAAIVDADVLYISDNASAGSIGTKLQLAPIGIVNSHVQMVTNLGIADQGSSYLADSVNVIDNSHYITQTLPTGSLTVASQQVGNCILGVLAPGVTPLARTGSQTELGAIDAGGALYGGSQTPARRVAFPLSDFEVSDLSQDATTLFKRSLQWASAPAVTPNALLHYDFASQSGITVVDRSGSTNLQFDLGNGSIEWVTDPVAGNGIHFNQNVQSGTARVRTANDGVADTLKSALQSSKAFTVQAFVKAEGFDNSGGRLVSYSYGTSISDRNFTLMADNDGASSVDLEGRVKYSGSALGYRQSDVFSLNNFHVLAYTVDLNDSQDNVKLYVDGELVKTASRSGNFDSWTSEQFMLGNEKTLNRPYRGYMYDVKMWDRALGGAQLLQNANSLLPNESESPQLIALYTFNEVLPDPQLAARWPLDEPAGGSISATDQAASNDGTYTNGATGGGTGIVGTAAEFDGEDDYVEVPHSDAYLLNNGAISFWFNSSSLSGRRGLFSKDSSSYDTGGHVNVYTDSSRLKVRFQSTNNSYYVQSNSGLQTDTWYHAAFTFGTGGMKLYLNGALVDTDSYAGGLGTTSGGIGNYEPLVLGANSWGSGDGIATPLQDYYIGLIDDVQVYDWALDANQVVNLFAGSPIGPSSGPGAIVKDTSNFGVPLDLGIANTADISWLAGGGLEFTSATKAASGGAATKLFDALTATDEMTIEVVFTPANLSQGGPARIVSYSQNTGNRNFTFGQSQGKYVQRLRTTSTSNNGTPDISSADVLSTDISHHVVVTFDGDNVKMYYNGSLAVTENRSGTFNWNSAYRLVLANEDTNDRPWLGKLHRVAVYDRALTTPQVNEVFQGQPPSDPSLTGYAYDVQWVEGF